ncbi:MAG: DUF4474 domain-containing protein [Oscillospiraceae bacterium]|jgi:hypothetical protein|nr:DUF4474 domain-containing protein [Oscillospiraceae bacterium]
MKRILALLLSAVLLLTLFAACGEGADDDEVTQAIYQGVTDATDAAEAAAGLIPAGWVAIGTLREDGDVVITGLTYVKDVDGKSVPVSDKDLAEANTLEGVVSSITVNDGVFVPVYVAAQTIYAAPGSSADDDDLHDLTQDADTLPTASSPGLLLPPSPLAPPRTNALLPATAVFKPGTTTRPAAGTAKPTATTKKNNLSTAATIPKTKKPAATTTNYFAAEKESISNSSMSKEEKMLAIRLLSYKIDENGIFYVEHEPWQKQFGFNQIYDVASPFMQLVYGTVRIKFRYGYVYKLYTEGEKKGQVVYDTNGNPTYETDASGNPIPKDWMIQLWKGRYGLVILGGEIGVYTKPSTQAAEHYYSATKEEELVMAMDLYQQNFKTGEKKYLFTRGPESEWWLTGFVPGSFFDNNANNKGKDEIIMVANLQFPDNEMLALFTERMEKAGFLRGNPGRDNPETFTTSGTSFKFSWQYIDQDR